MSGSEKPKTLMEALEKSFDADAAAMKRHWTQVLEMANVRLNDRTAPKRWTESATSWHYNPERRAWRGFSYKAGRRRVRIRVSVLREKAARRADRSA